MRGARRARRARAPARGRSCTAGSSGGSRSSCGRPGEWRALDGKAVRGTAAELRRGQRRAVRARGPAAAAGGAGRAAALPRSARSSTSSAATTTRRAPTRRCCKNRNALLERGPADPMLLDTYDEELARTGARVVMRRRGAGRRRWRRCCASTSARCTASCPCRCDYASDPDVAQRRRARRTVRGASQAGLARAAASTSAAGFTGFGSAHRRPRIVLGGRAGAQPRVAGAAALAGAGAEARRAVATSRRGSATRRCCCSTTFRASSTRRAARSCSR